MSTQPNDEKETGMDSTSKRPGSRGSVKNISCTAKVQKGIIQDFINGDNGRKAKETFEPRYIRFPMAQYTKRADIAAID